ncbi:MAG: DUF4160 domain-containing protein [Bacteroidota bacterium]|jgi:hypothetical protein
MVFSQSAVNRATGISVDKILSELSPFFDTLHLRTNSLSLLCMPTVLVIFGWRLFFYSNEGSEPIHIHAEKGDMECKFWLLVDEVEIKEAFAYNMTPTATREIKKIIYQHFDLIVDSWSNYFKK